MNDLRSRVRVGVLVIGVLLPLGAALAWKAGAQPATWLAMGAIGICCLIGFFQGKGIGGALAAFGGVGLAGSFFDVWPNEYLANGYTYGIGAIVAGGILSWVGVGHLRYWCAACGQFLGYQPRICERCGSNVHRTSYHESES